MTETIHMSSEQFEFCLAASYRVGREHRHREDELVRHNNAQLEENRAQRRQINQLEALIRLMRVKLTNALQDLRTDGLEDSPAFNLIGDALEAAQVLPAGEEYRYQNQVERFAEQIIRGFGVEDEVEIREDMVSLTEAISLFLRDEIGV